MKISIITVCYNSAETIKDTIVSINEQLYNNKEHLVVDGNSTDKTLEIIKKNSSTQTIVISEKDNGIYDAMNKGINEAKGDIIGILNSDDLYVNNKVLSKVASVFIENTALDSCYADLIYINKINTSKILRHWKSSSFIQGSFSKGWSPPHPTFFVRRSVYDRFGNFNLNYRIASDIDLMIRFLEIHKIKSLYIPEVWVKMRTGGISNRSIKNILFQNLEILSILKANFLYVNPIIFILKKFFSRCKQFIKI
jgi:glycosyltransferase involved in cell wall biosynthesis